ncbi:GNAT family N-acetyltransferase [Marinobacterium weihaiense]|uniref:GNAT family N-acetyltransferase n=1 Tax=Marinobacterium weihaiense TaxID=2851016 RepID=A0ABS6MBI6_9GAMM|nr:GNAT family N-acetyltransferase [Marinobacterium weihaiense]MBV0933682.1 GNAT family N-acetyltransferase [Marinobacterium weihaiense]
MIEIMRVPYEGEYQAAIRAIREVVFIEEQKVPPVLEFDGLDATAVQVLARVDGESVGTGRVLDDGHIGRIAVLKAHRGIGLGAAIVRALTDAAFQAGHERVYLGAQTHAIGFYETLGFVAYGEAFMDAGIPHRHMEKYR